MHPISSTAGLSCREQLDKAPSEDNKNKSGQSRAELPVNGNLWHFREAASPRRRRRVIPSPAAHDPRRPFWRRSSCFLLFIATKSAYVRRYFIGRANVNYIRRASARMNNSIRERGLIGGFFFFCSSLSTSGDERIRNRSYIFSTRGWLRGSLDRGHIFASVKYKVRPRLNRALFTQLFFIPTIHVHMSPSAHRTLRCHFPCIAKLF